MLDLVQPSLREADPMKTVLSLLPHVRLVAPVRVDFEAAGPGRALLWYHFPVQAVAAERH